MINPDLSIIIPTYNNADQIGNCLDSILRQRDSDRAQIIVVNDGSTDRTPDIVMQYQRWAKNILLLHQYNSGVSVARNTGIDAARGEYVTFIDADDAVGVDPVAAASLVKHRVRTIGNMTISKDLIDTTPQIPYTDKYFSSMLYAAHATGADVVFGGKFTLNQHNRHIKLHMHNDAQVFYNSPQSLETTMRMADIRESANFALYNRRFLINEGLQFLPNMHLDEDILFCMQATLYAEHIATVPDALYLYNRHPNSLSNFISDINSDIKYSNAVIQRYSILLQEIGHLYGMDKLYSRYMKEFARRRKSGFCMHDCFPSTICCDCQSPQCKNCYILAANQKRICQNVQMFAHVFNR